MRSRAVTRVPRVLVVALVGMLPILAGAASPPAASGAPEAVPARVAAVAARWAWPIAPPHPIARAYLAPPTPYGAGHRGIDIRAPDGAPVLAPADGIVHFAGFVVDRPVLSIEHGDGVLSSFEPVTTELHAGEAVHRGEVIGVLLAGHCAVSPCLHLGARVDGEYVNPLVFLGGVPHAVLYPTRR